MKRIFLAVVTTLFLVISTFASSDPEILIEPQPDSPLLLSEPVQKWRVSIHPSGEKTDMLSVSLKIKNTSWKAIRTYTIRIQENGYSTAQPSPTSQNSLLQPNQDKPEDIGEMGFDKQFNKTIKINVDFVEYMDGTVWGADSYNTREYLLGFRAGAKAALEFLQSKNKEGGAEAVITTLGETKNYNLLKIKAQCGKEDLGTDEIASFGMF
jgi:hypothetical protein